VKRDPQRDPNQWVEDAGRLKACPKPRLYALSHLRFGRTLPVENGSLLSGIRGFNRHLENGLKTFGIDGHGIILRHRLTPLRAVLGRGRRKKRKARQGRSRASESLDRAEVHFCRTW
jgi:hypothetical protein